MKKKNETKNTHTQYRIEVRVTFSVWDAVASARVNVPHVLVAV